MSMIWVFCSSSFSSSVHRRLDTAWSRPTAALETRETENVSGLAHLEHPCQLHNHFTSETTHRVELHPKCSYRCSVLLMVVGEKWVICGRPVTAQHSPETLPSATEPTVSPLSKATFCTVSLPLSFLEALEPRVEPGQAPRSDPPYGNSMKEGWTLISETGKLKNPFDGPEQ